MDASTTLYQLASPLSTNVRVAEEEFLIDGSITVAEFIWILEKQNFMSINDIGVIDKNGELVGHLSVRRLLEIVQRIISGTKGVMPLSGNPLSTGEYFRCPHNHCITRVNFVDPDNPPRCPKCNSLLEEWSD